MYLKRVFKASPFLFTIILAGIIGQSFIFIKRGLVFAPFYNYGMFSGRYTIPDSLEVYQVKPIKQKWLDARWSDQVYMPFESMENVHYGNDIYYRDIIRLFRRAGLNAPDSANFIQHLDKYFILTKHRKFLAQKTGLKPGEILFERKFYKWDGEKLRPAHE